MATAGGRMLEFVTEDNTVLKRIQGVIPKSKIIQAIEEIM